MLPKVESAAQVHFAAHVLEDLERKHGVERPIASNQIESPRSLVAIEEIAVASERVETLILGRGTTLPRRVCRS